MKRSLRTIANPLTLIAVFATISETSAAISLPFLDDEEREYYVWFLISFPFYLLFLFFITLNFNYRSLYSPSDFHKTKHFIRGAAESSCRRRRRSRQGSKADFLSQSYRWNKCTTLDDAFKHTSSHPSVDMYWAKDSGRRLEGKTIIVFVVYNGSGAGTLQDKQAG